MINRRALLTVNFIGIFILALSPEDKLEEKENVFRFQGDTLTSILSKGREKTILKGNVQLETGKLVIKADEIELSGENFRYASCYGHVSVHDEKQGIWLQSDQMIYDREKKLSRLSGYTEMEDKKNALIVRAGFFEYREQEEQMTMQSNVRIFKKDLTCRSDNAGYDRKKEILTLSGLPLVYRGDDEYQADHITVNLKTDEILLDGQVSGKVIPEEKKRSGSLSKKRRSSSF